MQVQFRTKLPVRVAIVLLGVILVLGLTLAFGNTAENAGAVTNPPQWNTLRGYIDSFFAGQYVADAVDGESGFTINRTTLKSRIDSNGNMSPTGTNVTTTVTGVLGEGDDAANAPVLLDNIVTNANVIPGTSVRCNWNGGYGVTTADNCFDAAKVTDIKNRVDAHAAAGFSTDIVVYCVSGRTESVVAGGMGTLAQTGALGDADPNTVGDQAPKVLAYKWGRNGWNATNTTTTSTAGATGAGTSPSTTYGDGTGSSAACNGAPNDQELVRCTAQWAAYTAVTPSGSPWGIGVAGYNISNGVTTLTSSNQVIDIRTPSPATTATPSGGPTTLKIPINTLFGSSVNFMDTRTTATKNVFVGRTTHVAGMAAINAVMLGYNSSFLAHGVNAWNTSLGGESYQTSVGGSMDTPAYPFQTATASSEWSGVDTTTPTITTASAASSITTTSADISRVADEPATMKVEYGTTSGGPYTSTVNNTVLNATKSVSLSGLTPGTTYYVRVTSCDGQANCATESEISFITVGCDGQPTLTLSLPYSYWASYADYTADLLSVDWTINNTGADTAYSVQLTGSVASNGVTVNTTLPVSYGSIAAGGSATQTVKYTIPTGVGSFWTVNTGTAQDNCATTFTYP